MNLLKKQKKTYFFFALVYLFFQMKLAAVILDVDYDMQRML